MPISHPQGLIATLRRARRVVMSGGSLAVMAGACRAAESAGPVCGLSLGEAVEVVVRDARTGAPLAAEARGVVRDGGYVDSLRMQPFQHPTQWTLIGGGERAGTYTVVVERVGSRPWQRSGVVVNRGVCGVETVTLVADLEASQ